jgi:alpha-D-xyloside xylohydrolase
MSEPLTYADEKKGKIAEIIIYSGADGEFTLYNDDGDDYSYEEGNFSMIKLVYKDAEKTLTFGEANGKFKYQEKFIIKIIGEHSISDSIELNYRGEEVTIILSR